MSIPRYKPNPFWIGMPIVDDKEGKLCEYRDYVKLKAENARLQAEVERLNELAQDPYRLSRGWQPMETAPKDGTLVLCWDEFKECDFMWYGIIQQWNEPKDILGWMYVATNTECHPTHWMPLPKPPAAKEGKSSV